MSLDVIPRAVWGAKPPTRPTPVVTYKDRIAIHHSADNIEDWVDSFSEECLVCQSYQDYHMRRWGAPDVFYGLFVFRSGRAYEGRARSPFTNNGGAYGTHNLGYGICFPGCFMNYLPGQAALETGAQAIREGMVAFNLGVERVVGHRDCGDLDYRNAQNSCPGDAFWNYLPEYQKMILGHGLEEVEDVPFLELDRRGGDKHLLLNRGYVYELNAPVEKHSMLVVDADCPKHDYALRIYTKPIVGEIRWKDVMIGGYGNRDGVHGGVFIVEDLRPDLFNGRTWITIHSPVPLHGSVL